MVLPAAIDRLHEVMRRGTVQKHECGHVWSGVVMGCHDPRENVGKQAGSLLAI